MKDYFKEAKDLKDQLIKDRRHIHEDPELGLELPKTKAYVKKRLEDLGAEVKEIGESGIQATIKGEAGDGKTVLIRCDMDALPMDEETGLDFSSKNKGVAHTCGHDLHTAIGLSTAKLLTEHKKDFKGEVRFMFQPAEEIFKGSKMMIENGVLDGVDIALALHTNLNHKAGSISYYEGYMATSCDNFKINIKGQGGHGGYPHTTKDPINAGVIVYQQFNQLISRDANPSKHTTLTFGQFASGSNSNIIPDTATLQGTIRTYDPEIRKKLLKRMDDIVKGVAKLTNCQVDLEFFASVPSLYSNPDLTKELVGYVKDSSDVEMISSERLMASEDMAFVSEKVPTVYFLLNSKVEGNEFSHHNPKVDFSEDAMPIGVGLFLTCAINWLNNN
ncbi:M20 family metallopeptidase [Anaerococcus porci]|uniref:M20 metallopeptidase family protein n=1 Tax=Anaerococcus porci TaxID=2652269 RepID=UPI002A7615D1|nr:M20 family metallopeptidase [Anaerococcus porci]MDY3006325.1 M20 family metallopeptidase [Anaerococcus porci]